MFDKGIRGKEFQAVKYAYWAGIIDGEGSISICKTQAQQTMRSCQRISPRYAIEVTITNTFYPIILEAQKIFGGAFVRKRRAEEHHKIAYNLKWTNDKAYEVLKKILPYLKIKSKQAKLAMKFVEEKHVLPPRNELGHIRLTEEQLQWRERMYWASRELNRRGIPPAETKREDTLLSVKR